MPELRYQLTFEGKVKVDNEMGNRLTIEAMF